MATSPVLRVVMIFYLSELSCTPPEFQELQFKCGEYVIKNGEKWPSSFDPNKIADFVRSCGYQEVVNLNPAEISNRFLSNRTDEFVYPAVILLCRARAS